MTTHPIDAKLIALGKLYYTSDSSLPILERGSREWQIWRSWRTIHKISTAFMDTREKWTVPCIVPPENLDRITGHPPMRKRV